MLNPDTWLLLAAGGAAQVVTWLLLWLNARSTVHFARAMDRVAHEMRDQTRIMERAYRGQIERNDAATQQAILTEMLQSGYYDTRDTRDALLARLDDKFTGSLRRPDTLAASTDLRLIINRAWRWDRTTILALLECVGQDLNGSAGGREIRRIRTELLPYRPRRPVGDEEDL